MQFTSLSLQRQDHRLREVASQVRCDNLKLPARGSLLAEVPTYDLIEELVSLTEGRPGRAELSELDRESKVMSYSQVQVTDRSVQELRVSQSVDGGVITVSSAELHRGWGAKGSVRTIAVFD